MTQLDMGKDLRDRMLSQTREGREERIRLVREKLIAEAWEDSCEGCFTGELTGDDVLEAAERVGVIEPIVPGEKPDDRRWLANVLVGWDAVVATERHVQSRRAECHGRWKRVWRWV